MSLLSNWRDRKKLFVRTTGRPVWWLVVMLILVLVLIYQLGKLETILPK